MKTHVLKPLVIAIALNASAATVAADGFAIEEIVVTATKRAESIQDVAISVSAFSGDFLEQSGVEDLKDLGSIAPNLNVVKSSQAGSQNIGIRGVTTAGNNAMDPSVAVYIDGAYMPRPGAVLGNLKDIEVAEVLRGPQGTLFGRNASMGALNIRTKAPVLGEDSLKLDAGVGDYGAFDSTWIANKSLGDQLAARVVAGYASEDGYGENLYDGSDQVGASQAESLKASFLYDASANLSILLRTDYQELGGGEAVNEVLPESITAAAVANINARTGGLALPDISGLDHKINQVHEDDMTDRQWGAVLDITWDDAFAGHSLRSITTYRDWQNDTSEFSVFRLPLEDLQRVTNFYSESVSQEIQLISPTGENFDYVAGLYYFQEDYAIDQTTNLGGDFCPVLANIAGAAGICSAFAQSNATPMEFRQDADSLAAFFQGTVHVSDQLDLTAGVRYSEDEKEGSLVVASNNPVASAFFAAPENHDDLAFSDSQVTWLLNTKYHWSNDVMGFATVSTGYKSGGLNSVATAGGLSGDQRLFDSEEVSSVELGIKSTLLDGRMIANVTLYRTDIEGFQDRSFDNLSFVISNAGELRQQGLELDMQYRPVEELSITVGYAYLDSEFLSFDNASQLPGVAGSQNLSGVENRNSPKHQLNLTSQWTQPWGSSGMEWFVRGEVMWTDDANVGGTTNNNPQTVQDAYARGNLRVGLTAEDQRWSLTAFVENVTDEQYCAGMYDQPAGGLLGVIDNGSTMIRCLQGDPRTLGIRGSYYFE